MINYIAKKINNIYKKSLEKEIEKENQVIRNSNNIDVGKIYSNTAVTHGNISIGYKSHTNLTTGNNSGPFGRRTDENIGITGTSGIVGSTGALGKSGIMGPIGVAGTSGIRAYGDHLAEAIDKNVIYADYIAENLDKNVRYAEYIAKKLDEAIGYTEYIGDSSPKKKEIKRIYTVEDPYGEENWDE